VALPNRAPLAVVVAIVTIAFSGASRAQAAQLSPMEQLARELGTPKIGYTARDDSHTHSMFEWVPAGETVDKWTKIYTVVASSVHVAQTSEQTTATILRLHKQVTDHHATVYEYDVRKAPPPVCYFRYVLKGEINVGVIFSPHPGIVTIQQVAAHRAGVITPADIRHLKALIAYPG
jgi:hypothetical protein